MISNRSIPETTLLRTIQALLVLFPLVAYAGLASNGFVGLDDNSYIFANRNLRLGFTWDNIVNAFRADAGASYWHPLTTLSFLLDYQIFGLNPAGYHFENLLFHCINVLLLFHLLRRTTSLLWPSAFAAALFALHPFNVEAVAWAVERKTVLSAFFFFLALICYLNYSRKLSVWRFLWIVCFFVAGLMAKSAIIMLPALCLALDFWPIGRMQQEGKSSISSAFLKLTAEKVPLFLISIYSVTMSLSSFKTSVEVVRNISLPWSYRIENALVSYMTYPIRMLWPVKLAVYYPLAEEYSIWLVLSSCTFLLAITITAVLLYRRFPWFLAGWAWYVIMLFPVSGLVQRGLWPAMADRFMYLPGIGIYIIVAWGGRELYIRSAMRIRRIIIATFCIMLLLLAGRTANQTGVWRNTETLFSHANAVTKDNYIVMEFLGDYYCDVDDYNRGLKLLEDVAASNPASTRTLERHLGAREMKRGNYEAADRHFSAAIALREDDHDAHLLRAKSAERAGWPEKALLAYNTLIYCPGNDVSFYKLDARKRVAVLTPVAAPQIAELRDRTQSPAAKSEDFALLATELDRLGFLEQALDAYRKLQKTGENRWQLDYNIANILRRLHRHEESLAAYARVLAQRPNDRDTLNNLGVVYKNSGRSAQALDFFDRAILADPNFGYARFNRACLLINLERYDEAITAFHEIQQRHPEMTADSQRYLVKLEKRKKAGH